MLKTTCNSKFTTTLHKRCRTIDHLKQIHAIFITRAFQLSHPQHTLLLTKLLLHFTSTEDHSYALFLFDRIKPTPNTSTWNYLIKGFSTSSQPEMSFVFFSKMRQQNVIPDRNTYPLLLKSFSNQNPNQIHAQSFKFGLQSDLFLQNSLVSSYSSGGNLDFACQIFDEISERDCISWTAMINGFVKNNQAKKGLDCFVKMRLLGVEVDEVTIVSVLSAVGMIGDVWFGRWLHGFYVESGRVKWDVYVGGALVDFYGKCGYCDDACKLFKEMPIRNVICWSALIAGYVQCSRFKEALHVFQGMLLEHVEPNQATLSSILTACAQLGALDQGRWVHAYIDKKKLVVNSILGTTLIDMYAKCGCIDKAFLVFQKLPNKDVYPWTAMINGLAMHGHALSALNLFSRMIMNGVRPNKVTFIGILCACCHGGLVDEGRRYFGSMSRVYGIEANVNHYGCMVDLLGRAGHLVEALNLIENMTMEPSPGVWGALFGACMIHKDFKLGERIGKHLIELQPHLSGRYVLLANLYSLCQKWDDAARVRKLMKGKGVEKNSGCSLIEVGGAIHEFVAGDVSHFQTKDIHLMLNQMILQLKPAGYVPDIVVLSFDLEMG